MLIKTDIAIIGAGPVGLFAAFQAGLHEFKSVIIDTMDQIGGQCIALYPDKPIYDIPAYPEVKARDLINKLQMQADIFKPTYLLGRKVIDIRKSDGAGSSGLVDNADNFPQIVEIAEGEVHAKAVIFATGKGIFKPNRPALAGLEEFEATQTAEYSVTSVEKYRGKKVLIAGGGDSAADWAIELANIAEVVYMIHRRVNFSCAPYSLKLIQQLIQQGKIILKAPAQIKRLVGDGGILKEVILVDNESQEEALRIDNLLLFFGVNADATLSKKLGMMSSNEGIATFSDNMRIKMNDGEASSGLYAVGDAADYLNKPKLILSGFHEATLAVRDIHRIFSFGSSLPEHSTSLQHIFQKD